MGDAVTGSVWRKRMQDLSRNVGKPHAPLFAPLTLAAAAQVEAIPVAQMVRDATRLRKNVTEMRRILGLDAAVVCVPSAMELEAVGAQVSSDWPPRVVGGPAAAFGEIDVDALALHPRVHASLEATRQIAAADTSEPVIVAALTGPATLLHQLRAADVSIGSDTGYEYVGRLLATLTRLFAEAGAHVLQLHESVSIHEDDVDEWKGALGTGANVARFHRVPPLLVLSADCVPPAWPAQTVACPTLGQAGTTSRAHGRAWGIDPDAWPTLGGETAGERYVTTTADLPADLAVAALKRAADRARNRQQP